MLFYGDYVGHHFIAMLVPSPLVSPMGSLGALAPYYDSSVTPVAVTRTALCVTAHSGTHVTSLLAPLPAGGRPTLGHNLHLRSLFN